MWTARPKSCFSWEFEILDQEGRRFTLLKIAWASESAHFLLDGVEYRISRSGFLGPFQLSRDEETVCSADKRLTRRYDLLLQEHPFTLEAASALHRAFLLRAEETVVGRITPRSVLSRVAVVDLPQGLPREVQLFLVFLVVISWRRTSNAAASS